MATEECVNASGLLQATTTPMLPTKTNAASPASSPCIILFYKYHPLSDDRTIVELYRQALEKFCVSLGLRGRILVGCSEHRSEGINGTLSGSKANLEIFVKTFAKGHCKSSSSSANNYCFVDEASNRFRIDCKAFYEAANCHPIEMDESEFKWSELKDSSSSISKGKKEEELFPDLNIKIVNELIGTGGVLSSIKIDECHKGYLTPQEWHERITELRAKKERIHESESKYCDEEEEDTILIDCRNTKEFAIGNFVGSIDPQTTTFNQFPKWVDDHKHKLRNKRVLMYCTGGIRCEKASAYVRHSMGSSVKEVRHLKGGIHKYLESFAGDGEATAIFAAESESVPSISAAEKSTPVSLWRGKNFVFDGRGAHGPGDSFESAAVSTHTAAASAAISATVGSCRYCGEPYDSFDPHCVCTVCKEPILICKKCQGCTSTTNNGEQEEASGESGSTSHTDQPNRPQHPHEYHCLKHKHLEGCYFTNLEAFSSEELTKQLAELETFAKDIAVGKKFRQRRKTLARQRAKIKKRLEHVGWNGGCATNAGNKDKTLGDIELKCRNCGQIDCSGKCWGFYGLKRKRVLEQNEGKGEQQQQHAKGYRKETRNSTVIPTKNDQNKRLKQQKELQKKKQIEEWIISGLTLGPKSGRDPSTGLRVPKPCVRIVESKTKGKWCGRSLLKVLQTEFPNSFQARHPQKQGVASPPTESETENKLRELLRRGLIRVNKTPIKSLDEANDYKLKNMDVIDRIVLWHEPPIHLPSEMINVQKIRIPEAYLPASKIKHGRPTVPDNHIYVCDKPSTVPVHPAGPYLSNSLTILVEAQEGLSPKTLIPCHRIDRVTSGMTICCTDARIAKLIQTTMAAKTNNSGNNTGARVSKQYLARVMGRFPSKEKDDGANELPNLSNDSLARWEWIADNRKGMIANNEILSNPSATFLKVDAPIETVDPLNGIRKISPKGKASTSLFRFLEYDANSDTSIIVCVPVTGRSHQLRVHLGWFGHSIVNDIQYGGISNTAIDPSAGVQRMVDNVREYNARAIATKENPTSFSSPVTEEQAQSAQEVCSICDLDTKGRGPSSAFSPAQLLQGGHAICLHAYRYSISFPSETKKESNQRKPNHSNVKTKTNDKGEATSKNNLPIDANEAEVFRVDLKVDLPPWASHLRISSTK